MSYFIIASLAETALRFLDQTQNMDNPKESAKINYESELSALHEMVSTITLVPLSRLHRNTCKTNSVLFVGALEMAIDLLSGKAAVDQN